MLFISGYYRFSSSRGISGGRGVRKNKHYDYVYVKKNKGGWGVKKHENITYKIESHQKNTSSFLYFSKPCVCGSLKHGRTTHVECVLNKKYSDV